MAWTCSAYPCLKPQGQQLTKNGKKANYKHLSFLFRGYKHSQLKSEVSSLKYSLFKFNLRILAVKELNIFQVAAARCLHNQTNYRQNCSNRKKREAKYSELQNRLKKRRIESSPRNSRPTLSQLGSYKIRRLTFLNYIKIANLLILR